MTSRVSLLAAATLVWPWEPLHLPEAPPWPLCRLWSPRRGSRALLGVQECGGRHLCWAGSRRAGSPAAVWHSCGDSRAGKLNRRKACKEMKDTGMSFPGSAEDVGMVVLSILAGSSLSASLAPRSGMLHLALPSIHKGTVWMPGS